MLVLENIKPAITFSVALAEITTISTKAIPNAFQAELERRVYSILHNGVVGYRMTTPDTITIDETEFDCLRATVHTKSKAAYFYVKRKGYGESLYPLTTIFGHAFQAQLSPLLLAHAREHVQALQAEALSALFASTRQQLTEAQATYQQCLFYLEQQELERRAS